MALSHIVRRADPGEEAHYCLMLSGHPTGVCCAGAPARPQAGHVQSHWGHTVGPGPGGLLAVGTQVKKAAT